MPIIAAIFKAIRSFYDYVIKKFKVSRVLIKNFQPTTHFSFQKMIIHFIMRKYLNYFFKYIKISKCKSFNMIL